jgi:hypothetical protein
VDILGKEIFIEFRAVKDENTIPGGSGLGWLAAAQPSYAVSGLRNIIRRSIDDQ